MQQRELVLLVMANIYIIPHSYRKIVIAKSVKLSPVKACPLFWSRGLDQGGREAGLLMLMGTCLYCGSLKLSCTGICYTSSFFLFFCRLMLYFIPSFFLLLLGLYRIYWVYYARSKGERVKSKNISNVSPNMLALASFLGRGQQRRIKSAYRQTTVELLVQNYLILWLFDTYWCRKEYISLGTSLGYIRAIYSLFAACVSRNFFQICRRYCLCLPQYIY